MSQDQSRHGVVYTPSTANRAPLVNLEDDEYLDSLGVKYIRITWLDYINQPRYRVVPRAYFKKLLQSSRPGVSLAKVVFGLVSLALAPGFSGTGSYHYVIDPSSFRLAPYAPGHASVMGFFQEKSPSPEHGLTVPLCPRWLLKQIVDKAQSAAEATYLVGFESEFILLSSTSPNFVAVNTMGDWSTSSKMPSGSVEYTVMEEIADCLEKARIELQMYHAEAAPGQYEVVTGPLPPLQAADALVQTRETIYNIANKHGLRATFAPRVFPTSTGNGAHTNISVHTTSDPRPTPGQASADAHFGPTLNPLERSFLQGVLSHAPAISAFTLPTQNSYTRVGDGCWSGGTYASWGTENREAIVRLAGSHRRHYFECRFVDATANPYLVLASILGAGTQALIDKTPLQSGDCDKAVVEMTPEEKTEKGVLNVGRIPRSLRQARMNLADDQELKNILGEEFVSAYLGVNEVKSLTALHSN
ncbi:glutamine synthetase/guanido kinase [Irpex rosettiformis]|uniref:Glutamine synthetase/guanido kinase n=1 Tax=Irpex rosettiformis TaxID=378272 RepID=A0ACB8TZT6_9APHY|nr:glutamine synthetase/guanido kinase [Irpex rosettiformis]